MTTDISAQQATTLEQYRSFVREVRRGSRVKVETPNAVGDTDVSVFQAVTLSAHIDSQATRIADLEAAIKRQSGASKPLRQHTLSEVQHLKDKDRTEYNAGKTLDSERSANAILTAEVDAQAATIKTLVDALERIANASDVYGIEANAEDQGADTLAYAHKSTGRLARAALAAAEESDHD